MRVLSTAQVADQCSGYFVFTFVRHPLDRLVSLWHSLIACPADKGFYGRSTSTGFTT